MDAPNRPHRSRIIVDTILVAGCMIFAAAVAVQADPREHHKPPPEAYAACANKAAAAECSVTFHDKTMSGTCKADKDEALFCRPARMPPPPDGEPKGPPPDDEKKSD